MHLARPVLAIGLVLFLTASAFAQDKTLMGFDDARVAEQRELEKRFDSLLDRENLRNWMRRLSARPHHVGSAYGKQNADFIAEQFRSWGYDTKIETYHVLFPTPKTRLLEMVAPTNFTARLSEPELPEDATSGQIEEQLPTYNAYSIDGDVTGELVYVNQGIPRDYEELKLRGVDVTGKIVIARYGGSWRGIKPKVAAENGAIGCIIYSDPRDDGYFQGEVYPDGPYRNRLGAQRGSVADMPLFPGDPLTPGIGATEDAERLERSEAPTLTKIPVLPISYADALPLLGALEGPVAPQAWRGALPVTYRLGPGPTKVHLKLEFDWKIVPAYDVIATIVGSEQPDEWIIRGNHHDAWVNGASDPISGMVATMEEARAIGELVKGGWQPKRTIVYCAWDAEEPGLLGSTEWAEAHADLLKNLAAVYINTDSYGRGFLSMSGSHTLEKFINEVARDVTDPQISISVAERLRASRMVRGNGDDDERTDLRIGALGSGSDYTPFLQHLGIASLNLGFGGENGGGSYHSIYDSFDHYTRFGDPGFYYGITLAKTAGRAVLRLANADVLPFEFTAFGDTVSRYLDEVTKLADDMRKQTERRNRMIKDGRFTAAADPTKPFVAPEPKDPVPHLNFAPLRNAVDKVKASAKAYHQAVIAHKASDEELPIAVKGAIDAILFKTERALTRDEGLPRRPWFKHQIYAPGFYTGYGVKTLPGVREGIEQRRWAEADEQAMRIAEALERFAGEIDRAVELIKSGGRR